MGRSGPLYRKALKRDSGNQRRKTRIHLYLDKEVVGGLREEGYNLSALTNKLLKEYWEKVKRMELIISKMAGPAGFEPATSGLEGRRPVLLGYGPVQWIEQNHAFKLYPAKFLWWASEKLQLSTVGIPRLRKFVSAAVLHFEFSRRACKGSLHGKGEKEPYPRALCTGKVLTGKACSASSGRAWPSGRGRA